MPDPAKYKPVDAFSRLNAFLAEVLQPDDLGRAQALIEELASELGGTRAASMATDAALRGRVNEGLARSRAAHAANMKARFPDSGRLGRSR
jgi:hypothetical protein